jgi:polyisoprenoid-binding protein YceI
MLKMYFRITGLILLLAMGLTACGLLSEPAAPVTTLEAIPLGNTATPAQAQPATQAPNPTDVPAATDVAVATDVPAATDIPAATDAPAAASDLTIYTIDGSNSQVSFQLDEVLRNQPNTVIGSTSDVAGEVGVNMNDLSTAQVGVIQINARSLLTDNNFRNRAIQNDILNTSAYELITFTPTAINGLPASASVGQTLNFTIDGDLTIRDVTQPVTFQVTATAASPTQITGSATATINRSDFNLTIPSVPNVANVTEEVQLTINFVANSG